MSVLCPVTLLNLFTSFNRFSMDTLHFSTDKVISFANKDSFYLFLSNMDPFPPNCPGQSFSPTLNRSDIRGKASGLSALSVWVSFSVFCPVPLIQYLFLCQYHSVLITTVLRSCLKSGHMIPPVLSFFLKIVWLFCVSYKF